MPGTTYFQTDTDLEISQNFFMPAMGLAPHCLGNVARSGQDEGFLLGDLELLGGIAGQPNFEFDLVWVPEPATLGVLVLGAVGVLLRRRRVR